MVALPKYYFSFVLFLLAAPVTNAIAISKIVDGIGDGTWYNTGLGYCELYNEDSQLVCAVSHLRYKSGRKQVPCMLCVQVTGSAGTEILQIVDKCMGCAYGDLDLSPHAFNRTVGTLDIGRAKVHWKFVPCTGSGGARSNTAHIGSSRNVTSFFSSSGKQQNLQIK